MHFPGAGFYIMLIVHGVALYFIHIDPCSVISEIIAVIKVCIDFFIPIIKVKRIIDFCWMADGKSGCQTYIRAQFFILFEFNIYDACVSGCFIFGGRVWYEFNRFHVGRIYWANELSQVFSIQCRRPSININGHTIFTVKGNFIITVSHYAWRFLQEFKSIASGCIDTPFYIEDEFISAYLDHWLFCFYWNTG